MLLGADDNEMASLIESRSLPTARVNFNQPLPPHSLPQQIEFFGLTTNLPSISTSFITLCPLIYFVHVLVTQWFCVYF